MTSPVYEHVIKFVLTIKLPAYIIMAWTYMNIQEQDILEGIYDINNSRVRYKKKPIIH